MKRVFSYFLASALLAGMAASCTDETPAASENGGGVTLAQAEIPVHMLN